MADRRYNCIARRGRRSRGLQGSRGAHGRAPAAPPAGGAAQSPAAQKPARKKVAARPVHRFGRASVFGAGAVWHAGRRMGGQRGGGQGGGCRHGARGGVRGYGPFFHPFQRTLDGRRLRAYLPLHGADARGGWIAAWRRGKRGKTESCRYSGVFAPRTACGTRSSAFSASTTI